MRSASLELEWGRLAAGAPPFLHPTFFLATARWMPPPGQKIFLSVRRGGQLAAMLPLVLRGGRLMALRSMHTPRYDVLGDPTALPALWKRMRDELEWHSLELRGVVEGSPLTTVLADAARRDGFAVELEPGRVEPTMQLDDFERSLSSDFHRDLTAWRREVRDDAFERVTTVTPAVMEDIFRIEAAAWKGQPGTAIESDASLRCFYTELARRFGRSGALSLSFLRVGGRRVAVHFALEDQTTRYLFKTAHDPAHARLQPDHLLLHEAAVDGSWRGLREIDFMGQDLDWARPWTSRVRQHVRVHVYRPTARGRAAHALRHRLRPVFDRLLHPVPAQ